MGAILHQSRSMLPLSTFIQKKSVVLNHNIPISQASRAICNSQIGCLLVGDEEGNAVGIVTDRDLVFRGESKSLKQDTLLKQIMSHDLIAADEDSSLSDVIQLMERNGIRRVPITHKGSHGKKRFSGIVTLDDLISANQVEVTQLSRIVRRQVGCRMAYLKELQPHTRRRSQIRSESHKEDTLHKFYSHLSKYIELEPDILPGVTQFILGALIMRVTFTTAAHFLA
jgi:CBS domain-containing protein